jgi:hypothetical protein
MLRDDGAEFEFMPKFARVLVNNSNGSFPSAASLLSGVGPFDFSSAESDGSVPVKVKIDNADEIDANLDLSAASDISAVTVAELVTAWGAVATATGITGSSDTATGRFKLAKTSLGSAKYMQVWGEFARLAGFGYGFGNRIVKINTQQSVGYEPVQVDSARIEIVDSNGLKSAVLTDAYRTGATIALADAASDQLLKAILTGGAYDEVTGVLEEALPSSIKPTFTLEWFSAKYSKDDNQEANLLGYLKRRSQSCKVTSVAGIAGDRNAQPKTYTIGVTPYRDPVTGVRTTDTTETPLTVEAYEALDVLNV